MKKPEPYEETKQVMDLMEMSGWIDGKYGITARDYKGHFAFNWQEKMIREGITEKRAKELYRMSPNDVSDEAERSAMQKVSQAQTRWYKENPYCDFWHFQLEHAIDLKGNDTYCEINLEYQLEAAQEDWQKEIAQMWLDEFGEYANTDGFIHLWVSW